VCIDDPVFDDDVGQVFADVGKTLATLMAVPKSSQLRSVSVDVCRQVSILPILNFRTEKVFPTIFTTELRASS
jgi:hypothetical protein